MKNQAAQVQKEVIEDIHANTIDRAFSFLAISVAASDIYASSVLVSCHCLSFLDLLFNSRPNVSLFIYCLHIVLAFLFDKGLGVACLYGTSLLSSRTPQFALPKFTMVAKKPGALNAICSFIPCNSFVHSKNGFRV